MKFLELTRKRRSVRRYTSGPVPREIVDRCVEAARLAPSACNAQPWSFIVVDDPELKNKLAAQAFSGIYSINSFAKDAVVLVVVVRERSSYAAKLAGCLRGIQYSLIDIGIACEHLVLQAEEECVGTCWIGWFNERAVKKVLCLPAKTKIDVIISMGYPEDTTRAEKQRKSLDQIRRFNLEA